VISVRPVILKRFFDLQGLTEPIDPSDLTKLDVEYIGSANPKDPVLSPLYSDLSNFSRYLVGYEYPRPRTQRHPPSYTVLF